MISAVQKNVGGKHELLIYNDIREMTSEDCVKVNNKSLNISNNLTFF